VPVSYHETYETYKNEIRKLHPKTMFDIGMGYGNIGSYAKSIYPEIELNGVEIFLPYLVHEASKAKNYKRIILADIRDMIDKLWKVDVIVAFDVIEHLVKDDGLKVMEYLKRISKMCLLISLPIIDYPQGVIFGNEAEIHRHNWKVEEMESFGAKTLFVGKVCGLFKL